MSKNDKGIRRAENSWYSYGYTHPIADALNKILQVIYIPWNMGKRKSGKQNIDTLFHLGIICDLENKKSRHLLKKMPPLISILL